MQCKFSAAHCVFDENVKTMIALPGRYNLFDESEVGWKKREIAKAYINPEYEHRSNAYKSKGDLAVLRMKQSVQFSNHIQPVCLPPFNHDPSNLRGIAVGYGYHSGIERFEKTPKQITMSSISFTDCLFLDKSYIEIIWKKSFCAKAPDGSPERGDSGGGYFYLDPATQRYSILGIVSHKLTYDSYTAFADVAKYSNWINEGKYSTFK